MALWSLMPSCKTPKWLQCLKIESLNSINTTSICIYKRNYACRPIVCAILQPFRSEIPKSTDVSAHGSEITAHHPAIYLHSQLSFEEAWRSFGDSAPGIIF